MGANVKLGFTADPGSALQPPRNFIFNGAAVGGATNPAITTATLPGVNAGTGYAQTLAAAGGTAPYAWSLNAGALPAGITLSGAGLIERDGERGGHGEFHGAGERQLRAHEDGDEGVRDRGGRCRRRSRSTMCR